MDALARSQSLFKLNECEVVGRELVVARCDPTTLLDPVEEAFDDIAGSVEVWAETDWLIAVAFRRDVGPGPVTVPSTELGSG